MIDGHPLSNSVSNWHLPGLAYRVHTMSRPCPQKAGKDAMEPAFAASEIDTSTPHPAVRFLVGEAGIRQIIDIGTGIPTAGNVHQVAGQITPGTRVVYADNDPIVHVHANALLTGSGTTSIVLADLREPEAILGHPKTRTLIDFSQPVGLLLVAILHFITEAEKPARILATLRDALPEGSYLVLSHATADLRPEAAQSAADVYDGATSTVTLRSKTQIAAFFDGWDLVEPGLVQVPLWRPEGKPPRPKELEKAWVYGGVAHLIT